MSGPLIKLWVSETNALFINTYQARDDAVSVEKKQNLVNQGHACSIELLLTFCLTIKIGDLFYLAEKLPHFDKLI